MYKNNKQIAILLGVYNGEKHLTEQVDSLVNQTNKDWTLYIRNDGSTDSTGQIIDRYCLDYPGRVVEIDKGSGNLGCQGNFFRLLETVESDYYMFCDGDDVWIPEKIQISYDALKEKEAKHPGMPLIVFGDNTVCDEELNIISESWWKSQRIIPELFLNRNILVIRNVVGGSTMLFNHAVKKYCFPIPADPPLHDIWIPFQTARYGKIFAIHKPLKLYRQHSSNIVGAPLDPYRFKISKLFNILSIIKRDYKIARYYQKLGYGYPIKYYYYRLVVLFKLQWSKLIYR